jgi:hypothetical protein
MRRRLATSTDTTALEAHSASSSSSSSASGAVAAGTDATKLKAVMAMSGGSGAIIDINRRHQMENWTQIDKANEKVKKHSEGSRRCPLRAVESARINER